MKNKWYYYIFVSCTKLSMIRGKQPIAKKNNSKKGEIVSEDVILAELQKTRELIDAMKSNQDQQGVVIKALRGDFFKLRKDLQALSKHQQHEIYVASTNVVS